MKILFKKDKEMIRQYRDILYTCIAVMGLEAGEHKLATPAVKCLTGICGTCGVTDLPELVVDLPEDGGQAEE